MRISLSRIHWIVVGLCLAALSFYSIRLFFGSNESVKVSDSYWKVSFKVSLSQSAPDKQLYLSIPNDNSHIRVIGQSFHYPDFRLKRFNPLNNGTLKLVVAPLATKNNIVLSSEFDLQLSKAKLQQHWLSGKTLSPDDLEKYLDKSDTSKNTLLFSKLNEFRSNANSSLGIARNIYNYVHKNIQYDPGSTAKTELKILETERGDELGKVKLMILFARQAAIPSRLASGVIIKDQFDLQQHFWVELFIDNEWRAYDPTLGFAEELPENYLRLSYDNPSLAYLADGTPIKVVVDAVKQPDLAGQNSQSWKQVTDILDLTRLSKNAQFLLLSILLLPFGALVTMVFRSLIGLRIYGSLTPPLIAIAILHSEWYMLLVVVAISLGVTLASKTTLQHKLGKIARVSMVATIAAIVVVLSISVMEYAGLNPNAKVVLLPMIVLIYLVDRFYGAHDGQGLFIALYRLIWTVIVTLCCLFLFTIPGVKYSVINYPEILLLVLALIMLLGEYRGKKLSNTDRFAWIKEPRNKPVSDKNLNEPVEAVQAEIDDLKFNLTSLD